MNDINATLYLGAGGTTTTLLLNEFINPMLATITGVLTILILSQKLYRQFKDNEKPRD